MVSQDFEYVTIGPSDEFSVGTSPDGEPGILIEQTAFEEPDRWLCFGEGFDDVRRMRELAAALRGEPREAIEFGGIVFERYRGNVGGVPYVPEDRAFAVPEGVPDLFITRFAPGDYMETVNTNGLPYYASQEIMKHSKGVEMEAQSNPINLCTRPHAVVELRM